MGGQLKKKNMNKFSTSLFSTSPYFHLSPAAWPGASTSGNIYMQHITTQYGAFTTVKYSMMVQYFSEQFSTQLYSTFEYFLVQFRAARRHFLAVDQSGSQAL